MIQHQPVPAMYAGRNTDVDAPEAAFRPTLWQRLAGFWTHDRLENVVASEVRRNFGRKVAEPGDVIRLNSLIDDLDRDFAG